MRKTILTVTVLLIASATVGYLNLSGGERGSSYRFVSLERGDLEAVVSSTGKLDAVMTVQVGTQVSGIISKIFVDFNDRVTAGQVIALLDTTLLGIAVRDAETNVERNDAQLRQAERDFERARELYDKKIVAEVEFNQAQYDLDIARAATTSAEIALDRARQNLSYATVYAPISGTVIERNVDVGQTVAASFSAPQLFLIANDLSSMQILASVDESDIGLIEEGQTARFTVQAYPDETFMGMVRQVRLQSTTQENVVNYTVVIDVDNADGRLLPGMTATVDFLVESATDVIKVANAALRFRPSEEMMAELRQRRERERTNTSGDSVAGPGSGVAGLGRGGRGLGDDTPTDVAALWYVADNGELAVARVHTGISDGQSTEVQGTNLEPGMQIIAGVTQSSQDASVNPFQGQTQERRGPPGPGF
jgi:HlyD family secretion protein